MTKQIINSFKELQGLVADVKLAKEPATRKTALKQPQAKIKPKRIEKPKKKSEHTTRAVDPKLQVIFDSLTWLKETFPNAFVSPPMKITALKIGIGHDIIEYIKTQETIPHSLTSIRKALSLYTHNFRYLTASARIGNPRIDLQGHVVGQVSKEQAEYAHQKLNDLKQRQKEKNDQPSENPISTDDVISESKS